MNKQLEIWIDELVKAREEKGWSREELAKKLHCPFWIIELMEDKRITPKYCSLNLSAYILGVDLELQADLDQSDD